MKVLQVINSLNIGGAERLILDSIDLYINSGIQMEVLLLDDNRTPFRIEFEKEYPNVKIKGLTKSSIYNPLLIFEIIPYLKEFDIVHLHLFPTLYWGCFAKILSFSKVKIVYTEHNTHNRRRNHFILSLVDKFVYKFVNNIGCITKSVSDELLKYLGNDFKDKVTVIENGISLVKFRDYNVELHKDVLYKKNDINEVILLQISNFKKQKDQETLIKSISLLPDNYRLLLVGDGENRENCEELSKKLKLTNRVVFLGQRTDIVDIIHASDIVILSSHWEGFGLAIVEGMAAKKPVIVSNVEGLADIVKDYGLVFTKGDYKDLSDKILSLSDLDFYNNVADLCLLRSKKFDISTMVSKYISFYEKTIRD